MTLDDYFVIDVKFFLSHFNNKISYNKKDCFIVNGEKIFFPYRTDVKEKNSFFCSDSHMIIYYCLLTRNPDGFVREKALKVIMSKINKSNSILVIPYLIRLQGEYVEEIYNIIYNHRNLLDCDSLKYFRNENIDFILLNRQRAISYWNCYYRNKYPVKKKYHQLLFLIG